VQEKNYSYLDNIKEWFELELVNQINNNHIIIKIIPSEKCKNVHKILHGGIMALIIDEMAFKLPSILNSNKRHVTTKLTVDFLKISRIKPLTGEIFIEKDLDPITVKIFNTSNQLIAKAKIEYNQFENQRWSSTGK
jgi:acyl-coenzyme A thioesterase PaaI-like protein